MILNQQLTEIFGGAIEESFGNCIKLLTPSKL